MSRPTIPQIQLMAVLKRKPLFTHLEAVLVPHEGSAGFPGHDLEKLLSHCQLVLDEKRQQLASAIAGVATDETQRARALILALLAACATKDKVQRSSSGEVTIPRVIEEAGTSLPRLMLMEEMAVSLGRNIVSFLDEPEGFVKMRECARGFERAIAPMRLGFLVRNHATFSGRVGAFMRNRSQTDQEVEARVREVLGNKGGISAEGVTRIVSRIGVARLRTYPERNLLKFAEIYVRWDPLIRYLEEPPGVRPEDTAFEDRLGRCMKSLQGAVAKKWASEGSAPQRKDAVSSALCDALETVRCRKYTYEVDFFWWMVQKAVDWLREERRKTRRFVFTSMLSIAAPASSPAQKECLAILQRWQERYLLVETFFQHETRKRVKEIWGQMLLREGLPDKDLVSTIREHTGEVVSEDTVAGTRRRLRQRLGVLHYVLDKVPEEAEDEAGDKSVLSWVESQWGLSEQDVPTVRALAGLARAATQDETLMWALVARLMVGERIAEDEVRNTIESVIKERVGLGLAANRATRLRFNQICAWMRREPNRKKIEGLHNSTRAEGNGFFLAPCWYLAVVSRESLEDTRRVLRPSQDEEATVVSIYRGIVE